MYFYWTFSQLTITYVFVALICYKIVFYTKETVDLMFNILIFYFLHTEIIWNKYKLSVCYFLFFILVFLLGCPLKFKPEIPGNEPNSMLLSARYVTFFAVKQCNSIYTSCLTEYLTASLVGTHNLNESIMEVETRLGFLERELWIRTLALQFSCGLYYSAQTALSTLCSQPRQSYIGRNQSVVLI